MTRCNACGGNLQLGPRFIFLCRSCTRAVPHQAMRRYRKAAVAVARFRQRVPYAAARCPDRLLVELAEAWTEAAGLARSARQGVCATPVQRPFNARSTPVQLTLNELKDELRPTRAD